MVKMPRRRFLVLGGAGLGVAAVGGLAGLRFGLPRWSRPGPLVPVSELSDEAQAFVERCFAGLDRSRVWDTHVHLVGLAEGGNGCWINPEMQSHLHPVKRFQFDVYTAALGMTSPETADRDFVERLLALQRAANPRGKLVLMGFDQAVAENGRELPEQSPYYTPNTYVLELAARHDELLACASIHPYRTDAVERLDACAEAGAVAVKWLPNAMGIDPASPLCERFYRRLAELGLPLITHGGEEYAVHAAHGQELGDPLRLRTALDLGVRVVVAHCASLGSFEGEPAFDRFMRLFRDPSYDGNLFGDISALTQINRSAEPVETLLAAPELHHRLVNGSDYPLPALRVLFSTGKWQLAGLLGGEDRRMCNEIAEANPLLFDFVLKRSLVLVREGRACRFADSVFETDWLFGGGVHLV
jgi:mannonate dehydratase